MSIFNYENEIEAQLTERLELNNSAFEVNHFYLNAGFDTVAEYILGKVKSVPAVFLRCSGMNTDSMDTVGGLVNAVYTVEMICATNDNGKIQQIKGEQRSVNSLIASVLSRLQGYNIDLSEQPSQRVVLSSIRDLFTIDSVDARMMTFEVQGVVIDFTEI